MLKKSILIASISFMMFACTNKNGHDASGVFETTEVIISSEGMGKILKFDVKEGDQLDQNQFVGYIDTVQLYLQKEQLRLSKQAINVRKPNLEIQISATREQIRKTELEKNRIENLLKSNAATQKQLDDIDSQLKVYKNTLAAQINSLSTSISGINEDSQTFDVKIAQLENQLEKCKIINPISGRVLNKYVEEGEFASIGKPLYKIADTRVLYLRAYLVSAQLEKVKLGEKVRVLINFGEQQKEYQGSVSWISSKAEFTPKTIQTKDERQNLVYAIKVAVENNDNLIKVGMYGDLILQ